MSKALNDIIEQSKDGDSQLREEVIKCLKKGELVTVSFIQRKFKVGYFKASRVYNSIDRKTQSKIE